MRSFSETIDYSQAKKGRNKHELLYEESKFRLKRKSIYETSCQSSFTPELVSKAFYDKHRSKSIDLTSKPRKLYQTEQFTF